MIKILRTFFFCVGEPVCNRQSIERRELMQQNVILTECHGSLAGNVDSYPEGRDLKLFEARYPDTFLGAFL